MTGLLDSPEALQWHLDQLIVRDPRLAVVAERAGPFEIRRSEPGFAGLAKIICGQQLSVESAAAIWGRFERLEGALAPETYLGLSEAQVRGIGFSGGKYQTVRGIAEALVERRLDLDHLVSLPAEEAIAELCRLKGVGPWTAEIYLMFSAAHPDVFPAGDIALQRAVGWAFGLDDKPQIKNLIAMAHHWSPHRSTAALLFWRYYRAVRNKEGLLV